MRTATLCLLVKDDKICLGIKKRKLGKDKYNGFGGMQEAGETVEQAALRELNEEAGVLAIDYQKVAEMYYHFPATPEWNQVVHVYLVTRWEGEPRETPEITAEWFPFGNIPYDRMWDNDKYWLPHVLSGKKVKGSVVHDGNKTIEKHIEFVETL
jgi:8-oxo-dGTP pyrophosphatase MutT (NUDIX family)